MDATDARVARLVDVLRLAEWGGRAPIPPDAPDGARQCPVCHGVNPADSGARHFRREYIGHAADCMLDAALRREMEMVHA